MANKTLLGLLGAGFLVTACDEADQEILEPVTITKPVKIDQDAGTQGQSQAEEEKKKEKISTLRKSFKPHKAPRRHKRNEIDTDGNLRIYFLTNNSTAHVNDRRDLWRFYDLTDGKAGRTTYIIEGHADIRGTDQDNLILGEKRANGIADYLRGFRDPASIQLQVTSYGEAKPAQEGNNFRALQASRRVIVIADQPTLERALTLLPADTFLLDATGSMIGEKWDVLMRHDYESPSREDPRMYAFNTCIGVQEIGNRRNIRPDCDTQLWDATLRVIRGMDRGSTLTILSDGGDNASRNGFISVYKAAKGKNIKVSTIGVGVGERMRHELVAIAQQTGGNFYIGN